MYRIWAFLGIYVMMLMVVACNSGKKKVAGGIIDETETDFKVSGFLLDLEAKPYARKVVYLNKEFGQQLSDTTDSSGYYEFDKVQAGLWYLVAEDSLQGLLREVVVDTQNVSLETATLQVLQRTTLVRSEQVSDTLFIVQLHRAIIFDADSMELVLPQGEYDFVAPANLPTCFTGDQDISGLISHSDLLSSSIPFETSSLMEQSSVSDVSAGSSASVSNSSKTIYSENVLQSSAEAVSASSEIAKGPVTLRYLFSDLTPTLDSSENRFVLSVSSGTPLFSTGMVSFSANACLKTPYVLGVFGSYNRMDVRLRLKGADAGIQGIFCNDDGEEMGDMFCLRRRGLDTLEFKFRALINFPESLSVGGVTQNTWMTVSAEINPSKVATLYIDGIPVVSKPVNSVFFGAFVTDNRIGCRNESVSEPQYFYGDIDSVTSQIL